MPRRKLNDAATPLMTIPKMRLITLDEWVKRRYVSQPPHINTVRKWAKTGKIQPRPQRHGKCYYVEESAIYVDKKEA